MTEAIVRGRLERLDAVLQRVGPEAILRDARGGRADTIDATAAHVGEPTDGRSLDAVAGRSDLASEVLRPHVEALLNPFDRLGLPRPSGDRP